VNARPIWDNRGVSILIIAVTDGDDDTRRRAVEALRDAGIKVYRAWIEPSPLELAEAENREVPDRDHLKGQRVRLDLNPWASAGPTEGVFNGQGEHGLSILVDGGGRFTYSHHEVAEVSPA
jgi:hypothetical protein